MRGPRRTAALLLGAALGAMLGATTAPGAAAAEERRPKPTPKTRRVEATDPWAYARLERAHAALAANRLADALAALGEMERRDPRLSAGDRALMHQAFGYVYAAQERWEPAATAFERALASEGLPEASRKNVRYNLAQLYVTLGRHDDAIGIFTTWLAEEPDPPAEAHYMVATAYMQKGRADQALPHARAAVAKRSAPPESWLQLLLALLVERSLFREAVPVVERLIATTAKDAKPYWLQLSALHGELGDQRKALGAMQAAHAQGMLTSDREIVTLTQLYLYNGIPHRAGTVLERAMADGVVPETAKHLELLANSWLGARERARALGPLARAAAAAPDGELYLRLAQLELDRERFDEARTALEAALAKGGLGRPGTAHLLLGAACASLERWEDARRAFEAAAHHAETAEAAAQWLASIESELAVRADEAAGSVAAPNLAERAPPPHKR